MIFLDLDDVLADFVGGAAARFGISRRAFEAASVPGRWDCTEPIGRALGHPLTSEDFWSGIDGDSIFWELLEPLPWAAELAWYVSQHTPEWYVLTKPGRCPTSVLGKQKWCEHFFREPGFDRMIPTPHKRLLAAPGRLLIDDNEENCRAFARAGGRSFLFPALHNRLHEYSRNPLEYVRAELPELFPTETAPPKPPRPPQVRPPRRVT